MDAFFERLILKAATVDELLSDDFAPLPGQKNDVDLSAQRLASWCRACTSGDWSLFERRLKRDGLSVSDVLPRLARVRRRAGAPNPSWIADAIWIEESLRCPSVDHTVATSKECELCAFEQLFTETVHQAETRLWSGVTVLASRHWTEPARACLRHALLKALTNLCAPALYERLVLLRETLVLQTTESAPEARRLKISFYNEFISDIKARHLRQLFEDKPVLLRLIATVTRQWMDTTRLLVTRFDTDFEHICRDILHTASIGRVSRIQGGLSDPHNGGHSVQILTFEDGSRLVYKPKDLRIDVAWNDLVARLNRAAPPICLKTPGASARDGYGWSEFIGHTGCLDAEDFKRFFARAGAWLALFHFFVGNDLHQENLIACGDHPVPIDLETILQSAAGAPQSQDENARAYEAAKNAIANTVMAVGIIPTHAKSPDNKPFATGGMSSDWNFENRFTWVDINTGLMRPKRTNQIANVLPNLPHVGGRYAKFNDYIDDFICGFQTYARFLMNWSCQLSQNEIFKGFAELPVRKIIRPTRFYYMLLHRLKNHRLMSDGAIWSAQAEFLARLSDWQSESDALWPVQRSERAALMKLNVPYFVMQSDGKEVSDMATVLARPDVMSGLDRARSRMQNCDEVEIARQVATIRQATNCYVTPKPAKAAPNELCDRSFDSSAAREFFLAESNSIARDIAHYAVRSDKAAAWIGLDWLEDMGVGRISVLGSDLYNGNCGIAVFLAAHAASTGQQSSEELARAALAHVRSTLKSRNASRFARAVGIGGGAGLGSVIYALAVIGKLLRDDDLIADACAAVELFTDDLIGADKQLDVLSGSAGSILGLLRLYRDSKSSDALKRAIKCGEHLLGQLCRGAGGDRSWSGERIASRSLNGLAHGAAGFAYALASLAGVTHREEFEAAASECLAFENSSYSPLRYNWPDLRSDCEPGWSCRWCSGAPGIGLSRIAITRVGIWRATEIDTRLEMDVRNAVIGAERGWSNQFDTLCCGALGGIEFFYEAGYALQRRDLFETASRRLMEVLNDAAASGDYRWNAGHRQLNQSLFRGLAGVGYTCLRRVDCSLPNVLIWQ
jgi:type 2 lantibiotic biosynthesis protein LanM